MNPGPTQRSTPTSISHTGSRGPAPESQAPDQYKLNRPVRTAPHYGAPAGPGMTRPLQTHMVLDGKFKHAGFADTGTTGDVIRALADGRTLARLQPSGRWSRPVREARERAKTGHDLILGRGPAVTVQLDKGEFY